MKKTLLFFALTIFSTSITFAQEKTDYGFSEKDIYISGSIFYSNEKNDDYDYSSFGFRPYVGFFVSENISINGGFIFSSSSNGNNFNDFTSKRSGFGGSLGATYFFTPKKQFSFMLNLNTTYERINFDDSNSNGFETKLNQFGIAFSPGINYFVSKRLALQLSFGAISYFSSTSKDNDFIDYNRFGLDLNLSNLGLGAIFRL
jgi:hypothetical protein